MKLKKYQKIVLSIVLVFALITVWVMVDMKANDKIVKTVAKDDVAKTLENPIDNILIALEEGESADYSKIGDTLKYIDSRYDTSDFRMPSLIRILYDHKDALPNEVYEAMKKTVLGFKYWMDQPGDDSMCYWSENHQLLFSSSEYLLGHYFKDEVFTNMSITGEEHAKLGKERVLIWLNQRYLYGFTEWYSSTYYVEDIAPLAVLIDFAPDEDVREKAKMVMDLLMYDLATQNFKGTFTVNSGRMYEAAKMSGRHGSMKETISDVWPNYNQYLGVEKVTGMEVNFHYIKHYEVPEVLVAIGYDQDSAKEYKASTGLDVSEYKAEGLTGLSDERIMMQFASEAFTNPEVIGTTIRYVDKNGMFSNEFLSDFKLINSGLLKTFNLTPLVSKALDPFYNGTAIQRANTYMYRTPDYAMSTAQAYHPGEYGDQQSLFSMTINNDFNIFVQHPAAALKADGALGNSPNYWVGNGYNPHTVQEKNINMSLYVLPEQVNPLGDLAGMARKIEDFTHMYLPKQYLDALVIEDNMAFAQVGEVYIAVIGKNALTYKPIEHTAYDEKMNLTEDYDLIQQGKTTYWITEVSTSKEYGSLNAFMAAIKNNPVAYEQNTLTYKNLKLTYKGDFVVDGVTQDLNYKRFDSPYATVERKADVMTFSFEGKSLTLDFKNLKREVRN